MGKSHGLGLIYLILFLFLLLLLLYHCICREHLMRSLQLIAPGKTDALIGLLHDFPHVYVLSHVFYVVLDIWKDVLSGVESRFDQAIDESLLALWDISCFFVHKV
jgi:hypothetical protein